jgi:hypothetical protein
VDELRSQLTVVVTGLVEHGVEHGSVVLTDSDGRTWQLGPAGRDVVGHRVQVTGRPRPDMLTTAQQGTVLQVLELAVLPAG